MVEHDGKRYPAQHAPIVDPDTFARAEQLLAANTTTRPGRPPKGRHLFRKGMLRCECGAAMVPRTDHDREYYTCHARLMLGRDHCAMPTVRRADIDTAVLRFFERVRLDVEATRAQLDLGARPAAGGNSGAVGRGAARRTRGGAAVVARPT
jgi:Recombinase zinc beta ribbon domain